jgi:hypothetical protein
VTKPLNTRRQTVELRPSRIRRDPAPAEKETRSIQAYPTEREVWIVVIGVILFAIAVTALTFGISDITAK